MSESIRIAQSIGRTNCMKFSDRNILSHLTLFDVSSNYWNNTHIHTYVLKISYSLSLYFQTNFDSIKARKRFYHKIQQASGRAATHSHSSFFCVVFVGKPIKCEFCHNSVSLQHLDGRFWLYIEN